MPELLTAAEFEQRVVKVSERLDALRGTARPQSATGTALPYSGLDLSAELPELATILAALIHQDPDEPITHNARLEVGARRLSLAAITALLQGGEGLADFPSRYQKLMGAEPEYQLFERVLPAAMREAGLPLPPKHESRRLLEHLLALVGLPGSLMQAAVEYFILYWRLFHPLAEPLAPLAFQQEAPADWAGLDPETRKAMAALGKRLLPNAAVVGPTLEGLARIMSTLRTQVRWRVGDLFSHAADIGRACGIDPRRLLQQDETALATLVEGLGQAWHPDQFRHVLMTFSRGSEVRLPSGSLAMVDKVIGVPQWGLYRLEHRTFMVLPNEAMTLADLQQLPDQAISLFGNRVVWRGPAEAPIVIDGWPQPMLPRPFYDDRNFLGWLYCDQPPRARAIEIGTDRLPPVAGVEWGASLRATADAAGQPQIAVRLDGLRVCLPELAGRVLQLASPHAETSERLTFELDARGVGALPTIHLPLTTPTAGAFELVLQDHALGEVATLEGRPLSTRLTLPEVMLFAEATGAMVPSGDAQVPFGLPSYLMFANRPINLGAMQMHDIGTEALGKIGDYDVHRLVWVDSGQVLSMYVDARHQWSFTYRVDATWQAVDLPAPISPLAFTPETPTEYTVASPDHLFIDDASLIDDPLIQIYRDGQLAAAFAWPELNWLMNYPIENRRFSGPMLRRALGAGPELDLAGQYSLALRSGGELLGERRILILPALTMTVSPLGQQSEETAYHLTATCPLPCFVGGSQQTDISLGSPVVDRDAMENSPFQPKPLESVMALTHPPMDLRIELQPSVGGFRLLDENEGSWIRKSLLSYDELAHITLVLFATEGVTGSLTMGDHDTLTEEFYEGFATFSLASLQETMRESEATVNVEIDGHPMGTLTVVWHPKITHFEPSNEYLVDLVALIDIKAKGPVDVPLRLEAYGPDGKKFASMEIETDGELNRQVPFALLAGRDFPLITVRVFDPTEPSGIASGSLEIRNASFEPEIEELNSRIAVAPQAAELRYERAQLLLAKGLRRAAERDFKAAIDLGMGELMDSVQYQQFLGQRHAEGFHEDIKALASFFVPFVRKELSIG